MLISSKFLLTYLLLVDEERRIHDDVDCHEGSNFGRGRGLESSSGHRVTFGHQNEQQEKDERAHGR